MSVIKVFLDKISWLLRYTSFNALDFSKLEDKTLGKIGEKKAAAFLKAQKFKILAENYSCRLGEIDIIARFGGQIVFVEVKTRRSRFIPGILAVTPEKQRKILAVSEYYCRVKTSAKLQPRFDIVCVYLEDGKWCIEHFPDSFSIFY